MSGLNLASLSNRQLLSHFEEICDGQSRNMDEVWQARIYNKLYDQMILVLNELKARPGDQRRLLADLYGHDNAQVRLKAAIHTLAIFPAEARRSEEHTSELQSLMRISYAVFCLKKKK